MLNTVCKTLIEKMPQVNDFEKIKPKVVLIDDDKVYQSFFKAVGKSMGVHIKAFESLAEMYSIGHLKNYDFAIVDFHLETFKGTEIAEYVDVFFPNLPVFLVSADASIPSKTRLPASVKKFFCKTHNPYTILRNALSTVEKLKCHEQLKRN